MKVSGLAAPTMVTLPRTTKPLPYCSGSVVVSRGLLAKMILAEQSRQVADHPQIFGHHLLGRADSYIGYITPM